MTNNDLHHQFGFGSTMMSDLASLLGHIATNDAMQSYQPFPTESGLDADLTALTKKLLERERHKSRSNAGPFPRP